MRRAAGAALLALAAALALVAEDVRRWPDRLARGDAAYATSSLGLVDPWAGGDRLPLRLGDEVLGIGDDLEARRAVHDVRRIRLTANPRIGNAVWVRRIAQATARLVRIEEHDPDPRRRAQAANLVGYLYFQSSQGAGAGAQFQFVRAALDAFRRAAITDPADDDAKFNVELLIRRLEEQGRRTPSTRFGLAESRGLGGATLNPRGSGY